MKDLVPVAWDDLDLAEAQARSPADVTVTISFRIAGRGSGWARELDLSEDHAEELAEFLDRYKQAGSPADSSGMLPSTPSGRSPGNRETAARNKKIREFAKNPPDGGKPLSYHTSTGKGVYYSPQLTGAFEAWEKGDPDWRQVYDKWQPDPHSAGVVTTLAENRRARIEGGS